jgi:hypothetical protein
VSCISSYLLTTNIDPNRHKLSQHKYRSSVIIGHTNSINLSRFIIPQLLCIRLHDICLIYQVVLQQHQFQNSQEPTQPKGEKKVTNICQWSLQKKVILTFRPRQKCAIHISFVSENSATKKLFETMTYGDIAYQNRHKWKARKKKGIKIGNGNVFNFKFIKAISHLVQWSRWRQQLQLVGYQL